MSESTRCVCKIPDGVRSFYCPIHNRKMYRRHAELCESNQDYFNHYATVPSEQDSLPKDIISKGKRFLSERRIWKNAGSPLRSGQEIARIYNEVCAACPNFIEKGNSVGMCSICGCYLKPKSKSFNKLAYATTHCPLPEPKWVAEVETEESKEAVKLEQEMFQVQSIKQEEGLKMKEVGAPIAPPPKKKSGKCCGR